MKKKKEEKTEFMDIFIGICMFIAFWTGWFRIESAIMFLALVFLLSFERDGLKVKIIKR